MNKRGEEDLLWNIILIMLFLLVAAMLFYWIQGISGGRLMIAQIGAKQAALIIDSAKPGTSAEIAGISFEISNNKINANHEGTKFSYSFFNPSEISSANNTITVKKKNE
jgi:hypothetical protein